MFPSKSFPSPPSTRQTSVVDAGLVFVTHVLVGPALGGLAATLILFGLMARGASFEGFASLIPVLAVVSYAVGSLPAALTGAYAAIRVWRSGRYGYGEAAFAGLAGSSAVIAGWQLFSVSTGAMLGGEFASAWVLVSSAGVMSALACRRLLAKVLSR